MKVFFGIGEGPSDLVAQFIDDLKETGGAYAGDRVFVCEDDHPRIAGIRTVCGAVVEGNPKKTMCVLVATTSSDGEHQEAAVGSRAQAQTVLDALLHAWPDLLAGRSA